MPVLEASDLYERASKKLIWMEDGVSVAKQKENRDTLTKPGKERTLTDAIRFADPQGKVIHLLAAQQVSLTQLATAHLKAHYGGQALSVILISDGSRTISNRCREIFGSHYQPVLDWYHLQKKMKEHLSMIAHSKEQKTDYLRQMMPLERQWS